MGFAAKGLVKGLFVNALRLLALLVVAYWAYDIRMYAIREYGTVIHEFDPWFNFRATQYLADNGLDKFFKWFDYMSWYPLGRPVGTTIYPGMQLTAVGIWKGLGAIGGDYAMTLNDVCCYVSVWFGVSASMFLGLFTHECSGSITAGIMGAGLMSVIPAHVMRSVGGGFDNESIAMTAMMSTFFFWVRSLRDENSWKLWGVVTGIAYINMVAAWGGYVFVLNMIAFHAGVLVILGRFSPNLHKAFSLFYIIGTLGAIQIPVVGWAPLKSMEQLGAFLVFAGLQLVAFCEHDRVKRGQGWDKKAYRLYTQVFGAAAAAGVVLIMLLFPMGYFGPLSSRIRGLFVQHTRTGNPLVDSVAEHQPATSAAYYQYLHYGSYVAPIGFVIMFFERSNAKWFLISYAVIAYFFSSKMMRLIIFMGPVTSSLGGVGLAFLWDWVLVQLSMPYTWLMEKTGSADEETDAKENTKTKKNKKDKKDKKKKKDDHWGRTAPRKSALEKITDPVTEGFMQIYTQTPVKYARIGAAAFVLLYGWSAGREFFSYSHMMAQSMSQPVIVYKGKTQSGQVLTVDDYREAYWYLRDNTPEDARVMAWWDYGYQITGIGNRTTIADGNTWNHEHIATLARCLVSPEKEAHQLIRHMADYVLVWAGGGGDDLAKSPHLARIGNSVFPDICPDDPTCQRFGFYQGGQPTPLMAKSLLYKLVSNGRPGVTVDQSRFREVFTSQYGKVRIYKVKSVSQESKRWVADPANRLCDAPGSWYCTGQYPPAINKLFKKKGISKKDFAQLEDFNRAKSNADDDYQKDYHARMSDPNAKVTGNGKKAAKAAKEEASTTEEKKKKIKKTKKKEDDVEETDEQRLKKEKKKAKKAKRKAEEEGLTEEELGALREKRAKKKEKKKAKKAAAKQEL